MNQCSIPTDVRHKHIIGGRSGGIYYNSNSTINQFIYMFFSTKKFNAEIDAVKNTGGFGDSLSADELAKVKQKVMAAIVTPQASSNKNISWTSRREKIIRLVISFGLGLTLVGGTAFASGGSLPGDPLYPIKRVTEKLELSLAFSQTAKVDLQAKFAQGRLDELQALTAKVDQDGGADENIEPPSNPATVVKPTSTPPASVNKNRELRLKARAEAALEVTNALNSLQSLQTNLEQQGDSKGANSAKDKSEVLRLRALKENLHVTGQDNSSLNGQNNGRGHDADDNSNNLPPPPQSVLGTSTSPEPTIPLLPQTKTDDSGPHDIQDSSNGSLNLH